MSEFDIFPNAEATVADELRTALGVGVYSSIPNGPTFPFVRIQRIGGLPVERHRLDRARLQVSVFGKSQTSAQDLAQRARTAIHELEGAFAQSGAFITGVEDVSGMHYELDRDTGRDRYTFDVNVYLHAGDEGSSLSSP